MARPVYPSWLPPNPHEREGLERLKRQQFWAILWLIGMLPAGWVALALMGSDVLLVPVTIIWIAVSVIWARRITGWACPRCGSAFCVRREPPYWYGLFTRRCESCGLTLQGPSSESI